MQRVTLAQFSARACSVRPAKTRSSRTSSITRSSSAACAPQALATPRSFRSTCVRQLVVGAACHGTRMRDRANLRCRRGVLRGQDFVGSVPVGIARGFRGERRRSLRLTCYSSSLISSMRFDAWPGPRSRMVARSSSIDAGSTTRSDGGESADLGWIEAVHPDDRERIGDYWRSCVISGIPGDTEAPADYEGTNSRRVLDAYLRQSNAYASRSIAGYRAPHLERAHC